MEYFHQFPNGLKVVLNKTSGNFTVCIGVHVGVGSSDEEKALNGISHVVEHMTFKGTEKRSAFQIADDADSMGSAINAFTGKESTCYYIKSTSEHFSDSVELLSDIFFHSVFDSTELEKEKNVILEEISMVEDTPDELCMDLISEAMFQGHPLGMPIIGTAQNVKSFTGEQLKNFTRKFYNAQNVVVSVAGNVEWQQVLDAVERYFAKSFTNAPYLPERAGVHQIASGFRCAQKEIEQANICISFPGICYDHKNSDALTLLNAVLGGGMSSRLFQRVREERGLAYSVFSYAGTYRNNGMYTVYAGVNPKNVEEYTRCVKEVVQELALKGITEKEFLRGREQIKSSLVFGQENVATMMNVIGKYMLMTGKVFSMEEKLSGIAALTLEEINGIVKTLFDFSRVCVSYVGADSPCEKLIGILKE
ncbi:MAG: insulinase family protein [Clostridia bacterium]|nr:insulinase family protein [Clostridia bacterium]